MKSSIRDKPEGTFHEVKGKVKRSPGSDNPELEAEGADEKIVGKVQKRSSGQERTIRCYMIQRT